MSLKSNSKVETNKYELEIDVTAEAFEAAVERAFQKAKKNITVQGFRKGKAPRKFIEKVYGERYAYKYIVEDTVVSKTFKDLKRDVRGTYILTI